MTDILITQLVVDDLQQISTIHCAAFPNSALTKLGEEAVYRYYEWQFSGPHIAEKLGAKINGQLIGFCFGGVFHGALSGFLQKNRAFLIWRIVSRPSLIANGLIRERIFQAGKLFRWVLTPKKTVIEPQIAERSFGILSIAVEPNFQGFSVGKKLMEAEELAARQRKFSKMHLTVAINNNQAIRFYERLGWYRVVIEPSGWQGRMEKRLEK